MNAISMWQPWASLWLTPSKIHETRSWSTAYRGWLAIHAAKRMETDLPPELREVVRRRFGDQWRNHLPRGAVIGAVYLDACTPTALLYPHPEGGQLEADDLLCGDFSHGRFAWRKENYVLLPEPIPHMGRQGFFSTSEKINTALLLAIDEIADKEGLA